MNDSWSTKTYWEHRFDVGDTPWELGQASTVVCEVLDELSSMGYALRGRSALSAGCGKGADVVEIARRGIDVIAVDWASTAVADARVRYERDKTPQHGAVSFIEGDFFSIPVQCVDLSVEHTFFCAIDPSMRSRYIEQVSQWIKPGGFLVGNFFVVGEDIVQTLPGRSLTQAGEGPPFAATEKELESLFSPYFVTRSLRPAALPAPDRRPGLEWIGIFERR